MPNRGTRNLATGRRHDQFTNYLALPYGFICWFWLGWSGFLVGSIAFWFGGLWLSPDLDTNSRPSRRWGPLASLWMPYRKLVRHRGWLSHTPILGSACRLCYLAILLLLAAAVLQPIGCPSPIALLSCWQQLWQQQKPLVIIALSATEASAWLYLIQDGDPMPL